MKKYQPTRIEEKKNKMKKNAADIQIIYIQLWYGDVSPAETN